MTIIFPSTLGFQVSAAPWQEFGREQEGSISTKDQGKFVPSEKVMHLRKKLMKFIEDHIYPMESEFYKLAQSTSKWTIHPEEETLKALAKKEGLWNLFIPVYILPSKPYVFTYSRSSAHYISFINIRGFIYFVIALFMLIKIIKLQLDSAARARKLLFEDGSLVSPGSSNDLLLGAGLTNLEYGYLCEIMGRSVWAPQIFNCGAPDTGNMEVRQKQLLSFIWNINSCRNCWLKYFRVSPWS